MTTVVKHLELNSSQMDAVEWITLLCMCATLGQCDRHLVCHFCLNGKKDLSWKHHIAKIGKKVNSAIYGLSKMYKHLATKNKKLKCRDHTHNSFTKGAILKLPDLIEHTTLCYLHSGLADNSPNHVKQLWNYNMTNREASRQTFPNIKPIISPRQWINDLLPNWQARLWNTSKINRMLKPIAFKTKNKLDILTSYEEEAKSETNTQRRPSPRKEDKDTVNYTPSAE